MIKKIVRALPLFLVAWFVITLFFYVQHYRIVKVYKVDKEIVLEDMVIKLQKISIKNYRYNDKIQQTHSNYELLWYYKLTSKLPGLIQEPFVKVLHFYSRPYVYNDQLGEVNYNGMILFNTKKGYPKYNNIWDYIDISLVDQNGVYFDRSKTTMTRSGSNYLLFNSKDENASLENKVYKIIVKDKRNNIERTYYTQPSGWEIKTITYFDREKDRYGFDPANNAGEIIRLFSQGQLGKARQYIMPGPPKQRIESALHHDYWKLNKLCEVLYEGRRAGLGDVYSATITFGQLDPKISDEMNAVAEQKIYFIERDHSPVIINADPVIKLNDSKRKNPVNLN